MRGIEWTWLAKEYKTRTLNVLLFVKYLSGVAQETVCTVQLRGREYTSVLYIVLVTVFRAVSDRTLLPNPVVTRFAH